MKDWLAILALGALAACGSKEAKAPKGSSFGQVLPGSASDAMLPYDTASSAPPLDARQYDDEDATKAPAAKTRARAASTVQKDDAAPKAVPT